MTQSMNNYQASCECGKTTIRLNLQLPLKELIARACDCDYCQARQLHWLSDKGARATLIAQAGLSKEQQGDNLAHFLFCSQCGQGVAVTRQFNDVLKGAVNASVFGLDKIKQTEVASPRQLPPEQKINRWQTLWMPITLVDSND